MQVSCPGESTFGIKPESNKKSGYINKVGRCVRFSYANTKDHPAHRTPPGDSCNISPGDPGIYMGGSN
jgi:hypothetical protein